MRRGTSASTRCASPRRCTFQMELHFDSDMLAFARHYFTNRSYLRIHGRPVVFLYLTRTLTGNVAAMIQGARTALEAHGYDPYFIGDEVYWRVTPEVLESEWPGAHHRSHRSLGSSSSTPSRPTRCTSATPIPPSAPSPTSPGYPGTTNIVADEKRLLQEYRSRHRGTGAGHPRRGTRLQRPRLPPGHRTTRPSLVNGCRARVPRRPSTTCSARWPSQSSTRRCPW